MRKICSDNRDHFRTRVRHRRRCGQPVGPGVQSVVVMPGGMYRAFIDRWTRMPHSIGRLSASASSHHSLSSAAFIINTAESDFRYTQLS